MRYEFRLPDVGEGIAEAEIVRWLVNEGQQVERDQPLVEIQTDKAIVEVPSPVAGTLERRGGGEGDLLHVGDLLVMLQTKAANPEPTSAAQPPPAPAPAAASPANAEGAGEALARKPLATPAVRRLARELEVNLARVAGSGPGGRIAAGDVQALVMESPTSGPPPGHAHQAKAAGALAPSPERAEEAPKAEAAPATASHPSIPRPPSHVLRPPSSAAAEERVPLRGLRRRIAETMAESWRTIPHISGYDEVEVSRLVELRAQLKPAAEAAGVHLTYLPFIVKAVVAALKQQPVVNAWLDEKAGEIVYRRRYNIGIATATPDGLIVPVVHDADGLSLRALQQQIAELSEQARSRRIALSALQGGTFTITNFGSLGGWLGAPIIRPGEAAILGVGRIQDRPWAVEGRLEVRPLLALSISADHRLIDGDVSTAFLRAVAGYLSDPLSLFLELT